MTHIDNIVATINTKNVTNAGTNGEVYLGIGGREFRLNQSGDQFKKGDTDVFKIGSASDIENPDINGLPLDPGANGKSPEINENILSGPSVFPVYIRLDPKDGSDNDWNVEKVSVVATGGFGATKTFIFPKTGGVLNDGTVWLGRKSGLTLFLEQQ
jgi:hypothetical protein